MKIVYQGYYGFHNSGDDAFVEVASWGAAKFWNCDKHFFLAKELPATTLEVSNIDFRRNIPGLLRGIWAIQNADIFVSAGGSTFSSKVTCKKIKYYARHKVKGKAGAIGVSLGPYRNSEDEKNIISYLRKLDFLALRDRQSYEIARSYELPYEPVEAFDLAALLPQIYGSKEKISIDGKKRIIGVSICLYESYVNGNKKAEKMRNDYITALIKELSKDQYIHFRFFIFHGGPNRNDGEITARTIAEAGLESDRYEIIPYLANPRETFLKVSECNMVISTRLHASIFACYARVPFMLLEYHRKCTDFLDDIGQSDLYRLGNTGRDIGEVLEATRSIMYDNGYIPPVNIEGTEERALMNFIGPQNIIR